MFLGCQNIYKFISKEKLDQLLDYFSDNMYNLMGVIKKDKFPKNDIDNRDLFLEEGVLGGLLGGVNFFRTDWLKIALTWITKEGCLNDHYGK